MNYLIRTYAGLLFVIGLILLSGGAYLLTLHGSPYYLLCGIAMLGSALLLWQGRGEGAALYGLVVLATFTWALWATGYDGWALMPRIVVFAVLGLVLLIPSVRRGLIWRFPTPSFGMFIGAIAAAMIVGVALHANVPPTVPIDPVYQAGTIAIPAGPTASRHAEWADGDWRHYGNDPGGTRFSALAQITPTIIMLLS